MGAGAWGVIGVNSHIPYIFLNAGLERIAEAGTIEDKNQEHQNNKDILNAQS
jgi:hypothetical protein